MQLLFPELTVLLAVLNVHQATRDEEVSKWENDFFQVKKKEEVCAT